jgi:nucleotide-binding universal stress UspA family protein
MLKKVVLSVDPSPESRAATAWCVENLSPATIIVAVCGINDVGEFVIGLPLFDQAGDAAELHRALESRWVAPLREAGFDCRPRFMHHTQATAIREAVADEHPDAVIVGKAAHGALREHLAPGLAGVLTHHMPCPVILVPVAEAAPV